MTASIMVLIPIKALPVTRRNNRLEVIAVLLSKLKTVAFKTSYLQNQLPSTTTTF